ncbi:hypothetical protein [Vibrio brasiliensis]|uniref:hypothetical protein n=1 Tax=Vibrio brasiliensis TaxID=170652 RepID=UPI001EFEA61C|nr:hypothetical protein [Vibrio brasiliensis]MCG9728239.1 hypothetical protein [Vibrio brasiliensis]
MIVFDISSAYAISHLFKKGTVQEPMDFFLEEGGKRYRLTDVKELREEFEENGVFQSVFLGYRLTFNGGCTVKIDAIKSIVTLTLPDNNPENTLDRESFAPNNVKDWARAGINKFLF